jgi:RNA polymerase sigma-70 factor (ECF subfamily)
LDPRARDDTQLLLAWRNGDTAAANELTERHYASVRRFFDLKATPVADDLTQATFLGLVERIGNLREHASFKSYLFGIARNQLMGYLRKQGRMSNAMMFASAAPAKEMTPLSMVAARHQEQHLLLLALAQLSTDHQIAIELYYWEGMPVAEIGAVLEINPSTVTSRLARAREQIREQVVALSRPGLVQQALLSDLEGWQRSLGAVTAAANARRPH